MAEPRDLSRVVVVGSSGSGKTTFARELAKRLGSTHVEIDAIHWQADWVPLPREALRARLADALAGERWVVDGNYGSLRDLIWPRATAIIWLDFRFHRVFLRSLTRTLRRIVSRDVIYSGNTESFWRTFFTSDSILWWVIKRYARRRRDYLPLLCGESADPRALVMREPRLTGELLASLEDTSGVV